MDKNSLYSPVGNSELSFKNRIFMAPMTRSRSAGGIPGELVAEYYSQRASAGLIFTEGTQVSLQGVGYINTPGIHTAAQVEAWKKTTAAVHAKGGLIFCQLWHVGRVSHPDFHDGALPVAPSAVAFEGKSFTKNGLQNVVTPRALGLQEIEAIVEDHRRAALLAKEAGFDGVEIHGANGYLPAQFLEDGSNKRTDAYGGPIENRARFLLAITDAAVGVWGAGRVSVRLSPRNPFNGMSDSAPEKTYLYVVKELEKRGVGLLHLVESVESPAGVRPLAPEIRKSFSGILVLNAGYTQATAEEAVLSGKADAVSFATLFLANPDLPERFERGAPLNAPDRATFYGGSAKGYTDYPALERASR